MKQKLHNTKFTPVKIEKIIFEITSREYTFGEKSFNEKLIETKNVLLKVKGKINNEDELKTIIVRFINKYNYIESYMRIEGFVEAFKDFKVQYSNSRKFKKFYSKLSSRLSEEDKLLLEVC